MREFEERNMVTIEGRELIPADAQSLRGIESFRIGYKEALSRRKTKKEEIGGGKPSVIILGSFSFKEGIDNASDLFTSNNIEVLAPKKGKVIGEVGGFKLLEGDEGKHPSDLWADFLDNISRADVAYVYSQNGYIGTTVRIEIMIAADVVGVPIYALEPIKHEIKDSSGRNITAAIKKISPIMLAALMRSKVDKDFSIEGQFWNKTIKERPQVQVFGYTDDTGTRAMFIDII